MGHSYYSLNITQNCSVIHNIVCVGVCLYTQGATHKTTFFMAHSPDTDVYVYQLDDPARKAVKIGLSTDVRGRGSNLNSASKLTWTLAGRLSFRRWSDAYAMEQCTLHSTRLWQPSDLGCQKFDGRTEMRRGDAGDFLGIMSFLPLPKAHNFMEQPASPASERYDNERRLLKEHSQEVASLRRRVEDLERQLAEASRPAA